MYLLVLFLWRTLRLRATLKSYTVEVLRSVIPALERCLWTMAETGCHNGAGMAKTRWKWRRSWWRVSGHHVRSDLHSQGEQWFWFWTQGFTECRTTTGMLRISCYFSWSGNKSVSVYVKGRGTTADYGRNQGSKWRKHRSPFQQMKAGDMLKGMVLVEPKFHRFF